MTKLPPGQHEQILEAAVVTMRAAGHMAWQPDVRPLTEADVRNGWIRPADIFGDARRTKQVMDVVRAKTVARRAKSGTEVPGIDAWTTDSSTSWCLPYLFAGELPALMMTTFVPGTAFRNGQYVVAPGPGDYAFRATHENEVELRLLPGADLHMSRNRHDVARALFASVQASVDCCAAENKKGNRRLRSYAARLVANWVVLEVKKTSRTAKQAQAQIDDAKKLFGPSLTDLYSFEIIAKDAKATVRGVTAVCCDEPSRSGPDYRCGGCPHPMEPARAENWGTVRINESKMTIGANDPAVRGEDISTGRHAYAGKRWAGADAPADASRGLTPIEARSA